MPLHTKSIQEKKLVNDGIRICIMRRIKPEFEFDIWIPTLSPSTELLKLYHDKVLSWDDYEKQFTEQVLEKQTEYLIILTDIVKKHKVTILCWEDTADMCHRRLVAQWIAKQDSSVEVTIN